MHEYKQNALDLLSEFPDNKARKALEELIQYTIDRNK